MRRRGMGIVLLAAAAGALGADRTSNAQGAPTPCYRLAFGVWSPPLDWDGAGHGRTAVAPPAMASRRADRLAPGDRDFAAFDPAADSTMLLFPAWWPVGVLIRFDPRPVPGDTIRGTATALVADGGTPRSVAGVRIVPFPCTPPPAPGAR
jgi:hypothetical protein